MDTEWKWDEEAGERYYYNWRTNLYFYESGRMFNADGAEIFAETNADNEDLQDAGFNINDEEVEEPNDANSMLLQPEPHSGRYEFKSRLGRGSQATVDAWYDKSDDEVYAIKEYSFMRDPDPEMRRRVYQEVALLANLSRREESENYIVRLIRWHEEGSNIRLVMYPCASQGTLASLLARQFNSLEEVITWEFLIEALCNLTAGLTFIHQESIRHKDISPSNILIHEGRALYTDFGISIPFDRSISSTGETASREPLLPTYNTNYTAPELLSDTGTRSIKSDVFSLGCVFWELLAARSVFLVGDKGMGMDTVYDKKFYGYGRMAVDGRLRDALSEVGAFKQVAGLVPIFYVAERMVRESAGERLDADGVYRELIAFLY